MKTAYMKTCINCDFEIQPPMPALIRMRYYVNLVLLLFVLIVAAVAVMG